MYVFMYVYDYVDKYVYIYMCVHMYKYVCACNKQILTCFSFWNISYDSALENDRKDFSFNRLTQRYVLHLSVF
jgi:hypothetical protein